MEYIYFCPKCKAVYGYAVDQPGTCSNCRINTVSTGYDSQDWYSMKKPERDAMIEKMASGEPLDDPHILEHTTEKYIPGNDSEGGIVIALKNGFESMLSIMTVLSVIMFCIAGYMFGDATDNTFFGLVVGFVIGIIYNIAVNGLFATIIHISNTNDKILYYLQHRDDK